MSDPRDLAPDPWDARPDHFADEPDPTGVRAMLSALPDPGPMPDDLIQRITASLAAEQATHERRGRPEQGGAGTLDSLASARERRTHLGRRLPAMAVAASIVILAGAVVLALFAMNNGLGMSATYDVAAESSVSDGGGGQGDDAGSAEPFGSSETAPPDTEEGRSLASASTHILATGALLTSANLIEHARTVRNGSTTLGPDPEAARTMTTSPLGSPEGAADCLSGLLAITAEEAAALVEAVDFVHFDGVPAALILTDDNGAGVETPESTAYLVPLDCGPRGAVPLHEPVRIDS